MREIKFRAWDRAALKMSPEFNLFGEFTLLGAIHCWQDESKIEGSSLERLNDLEIMQYTGLKDKNGKEIYEGDVVESPFTGDPVQVVWCGAFAQFTFGGAEFNVESSPNNIEVIGNIYENPELIK